MSEGSTSPAGSSPTKRIEFIDLLRGWAVIIMIETHVVNATVSAEITNSEVFQWIKFLNGLVAPSFLFASGMAYAVTTRRKVNDYLALGTPLFRQFGRLVLILFVGYMLHLPEFSYRKLMEGVSEQQWLVFFQVDVLQCIALSLLVMQVLLLVLRSERTMYAVIGVCTAVVLFSAPLMWGIEFLDVVPAPIAAYLNGQHYSLFPLFPWSVFLFAGALTGYLYINARQRATDEERFMRRLFLAGIGVFLCSFILQPISSTIYPSYDYWRYGPPFVLLRNGMVIVLLVGLFHFEKRIGVSPRSIVALLGRESLLVYAAHLLLIYGDFGTFNFREEVHHTYGYEQALLATLALLLLMYAMAFTWNRIKRESPTLKTWVNAGVVVGLLLVFFFGPGE